MHRRCSTSALLLLAAAALVTACGSTPPPATQAPAATASAPGATGPAPSAGQLGTPAPTPAASGGTIISDAVVPAGVQYLEPATTTPWGLPADARWDAFATVTAGVAAPDLAIGQDAKQGAVAAVRSGSTWRRTLLASTASIKGPGRYVNTDYVTVSAGAASERGYLVTAAATITDAGRYGGSGLGFAWFSKDGAVWKRTDFRGLFGTTAFFAPTAVTATRSGWLVVGALTDREMRAKSQLVAVASADGTAWHEVSRIKDTWALTSRQLDRMGGRIILAGTAWMCATDGSEQHVGIGNPQLRLWSTTDDGITWTAGDWTAGGVNPAPGPAPVTKADCANVRIGQLAAYGNFLGVVNGRAVVVAPDNTKAATSADLTQWSVGELAGAKPSGGPTSNSLPRALAAVPDGDAVVVLSLEPRRDDKDVTGAFGQAVIAWRSGDGAAWTRQPAARPVETLSTARFLRSPDGSVYLATGSTTSIGAQYRRSVAGKAVTQLACKPGPGADCSFTTLGGSLIGADLDGIDLYGSVIATGTDLSGATLAKANLTGLSIQTGANLRGADLSGTSASRLAVAVGAVLAGASLRGANLTSAEINATGADATGVTLTGANLKGASLDGVDLRGGSLAGTVFDQTRVGTTMLDANLAGADVQFVSVGVGPAGAPDALAGYNFGTRNLAHWFFRGASYKKPGDMHGADFSHAKVGGSGFDSVDLTGAVFPAGATSQLDITDATAIYFYATVVCPDGKAPDKSGYMYECRLPK